MASAAEEGGIELSDRFVDVELGQPSITGRQRSFVERISTGLSGASTVVSVGFTSSFSTDLSTTFSNVLSRYRRTNTLIAPGDEPPEIRLLDDPSMYYLPDGNIQEMDMYNTRRVSQALLFALCGTMIYSDVVEKAAEWYITFLTLSCREAWSGIITPVLDCTDPDLHVPSQRHMCTIFRMLRTLVLTVKQGEDIAITDLVDALYNGKYLRHIEEDLDMNLAKIMAFTAFGRLTMLCNPSSITDGATFQILGPSNLQQAGTRQSCSGSNPTASKRMKQDLQLADQPISSLLKAFGNDIPHSIQPLFSGQSSPLAAYQRPEELIDASTLCFRNLHNLMHTTIHWVDCLSLHLDYNRQTNVLSLFRFPSFCLLMCYSETNFLSRLFSDNQAPQGFSNPERNYSGDYFKEVLLSYRLLFGESMDSYGLYSSPKDSVTLLGSPEHDPLLDIICGQSCHGVASSMIWETIGVGGPLGKYATQDFDFLNPRLLLIQNAIKVHQPEGIRSMWYDRRDVHGWWAFWPLFLISGAVLILGVFQASLQAVQLYFTLWPLKTK